ncbi:hypothetical protein IWX83_002693 [Flavobacterium sp. CG_9.1]|uniref:hypothetical protein n=1 Tax=Flavobacterium sp. CG_9.1 TaxID=2787728 RepID=UPI0018CA14C7|nr:hypothetical protein [Flavobacterium sp. CG_9.1]MBG6062890.1 hypothetical protein [Flavobacterium sp. CG_9.1]
MNYIQSTSAFHVTWLRKINPVYRLLSDIKYIEDFFENGNIYLSSFNNFKKYEDEMQGDKTEGHNLVGGFNGNNASHYISYEGGFKAYVLCATNSLNENVKKDFKGVGAIKINDPVNFGKEIARKMPYVTTGIEGDCIYGDSKTQTLKEEQNKIFQNIDFQNPTMIREEITQLTLGVEMFMKHKKYEHQDEHRLLWFSEVEIQNGILVHCPEATKYCDKIIF